MFCLVNICYTIFHVVTEFCQLLNKRICYVVVVLLYGLVSTRLQHSKNIHSCVASQGKSNTDNKTLMLLK